MATDKEQPENPLDAMRKAREAEQERADQMRELVHDAIKNAAVMTQTLQNGVGSYIEWMSEPRGYIDSKSVAHKLFGGKHE